MKKKIIIRDDEVNLYESKSYETFDSEKLEALDKTLQDSEDCDDVIYNIATVSDKEINCRIYPDEHIKDTVTQKKWLKPFLKPFLVNHDIYTEPLGRIEDAYYVNHSDLTSIGGNETIPEAVIMKFKKDGFLDEGTGSVILKIKPFGETAAKIKDGRILTTSQASATDSITCSICGKDYYECDHRIGSVYDGKKALLRTGALEPYENSSVNRPANDSSVVLCYNKTTDCAEIYGTDNTAVLVPQSNKDSVEEEQVETLTDNKEIVTIDAIIPVEDNIVAENTRGEEMKDEKISLKLKKLKDRTLKDLKRFYNEDGTAQFEAPLKEAIDAISEDEILNVMDILEVILEAVDKKNEIQLASFGTIIAEEETQDEEAEVQDEEAEEETVVTETEESKVQDEVVEEETVVEDSTNTEENVINNDVPENVPDFLSKKEPETKVIATDAISFDREFLINLSNPRKIFDK